MKGGLHNQLMAFLALGNLASKLNRTLVVPQFLFDFPGSDKNAHVEFEDTFNMSTLVEKGFPSQLVTLLQIPAGLFVKRHATVSVGDKDLPVNATKPLRLIVEGKLKEFNETVLLTAEREAKQLMSEPSLVSRYDSFALNNKLSNVFEACLRFILGKDGKDGSSEKIDWGSIVYLHLRIESDWLEYAKKKAKKQDVDFEDIYSSLEQIKAKFHASVHILDDTASATGAPRLTIVLSYAAGKLPKGTYVSDLQAGWPEGFRVVTSDELEAVVGQYSYLQRSALLSQVAYKSGVFVGNHYSSFSKVIGQARNGKLPSFKYNTQDETIVPMKKPA